MRTGRLFGIAAAIVIVAPLSAGAEDFGDVEKKLDKMVSRYKTITYKTKTTQDMKAPEVSVRIQTDGLFEAVRRGDSWLSRMEARTTTVEKDQQGKETKDTDQVLQIFDGEYAYTLTDSEGKKEATRMKMKPDGKTVLSPFDVKGMFQMLRRDFSLRLLPDQEMDGEKVYVIEATPRKGSQIDIGRSVSYYRKDTGIVAKGVTYDKAGKAVSTTLFTDVRTNAELAKDRFVFKAPAGLEVLDVTNAPPPGEQGPDQSGPSPARK